MTPPGPPRPSTPRQPSNPKPGPPPKPGPSNPKPVRMRRRSWRQELAYQFQRSTGTALVLAGLYLATGLVR